MYIAMFTSLKSIEAFCCNELYKKSIDEIEVSSEEHINTSLTAG